MTMIKAMPQPAAAVELLATGTGADAGTGAVLDLAPARRPWLRRLRRVEPGLVLAWAVIALVVLWAAAPWLFTDHNPLAGTPAQRLRPPSALHWFGTDMLGRDLYARVVHGAVHSLSGAFFAVAVGFLAGTLIGVVAGSAGRVADDVLMRVVDTLLAVPTLLLSLSILMIMGFGTINAAVAVGVTAIASFARLVRSEVIRVRRTEYVEAAFGSGGGFLAVLWRHVLPNSLTSAFALAALQFGMAILAISTLSFLGYGAPPPTPEWGLLIAEGRNYLATAWWLTTIPGLVVVAVVLSANRISRSLGKDRR